MQLKRTNLKTCSQVFTHDGHRVLSGSSIFRIGHIFKFQSYFLSVCRLYSLPIMFSHFIDFSRLDFRVEMLGIAILRIFISLKIGSRNYKIYIINIHTLLIIYTLLIIHAYISTIYVKHSCKCISSFVY